MAAPSGGSFDGAEHLRLDVLAHHQVIHLGTFAAWWFHRLWNPASKRRDQLDTQEARFLFRLLALEKPSSRSERLPKL